MSSHTADLAYQDEPHWLMCLREYCIPAVVFVAMLYYLMVHVCMPMRRLKGLTREFCEEKTSAQDDSGVANGDDRTSTPMSRAKKQM
ncbi:hypothetical protein JKF63_04312 [Porcisia hertigi]|uniref:Uncharacterized protein n=1 Tax=Porcisia hertigi TaxID=2761500 RepID=A0A836IE47_9TRYP|nr:hypothetical protein JKF63_04312 [Porcisia hertigi]